LGHQRRGCCVSFTALPGLVVILAALVGLELFES
jgi:hypothetical protein